MNEEEKWQKGKAEERDEKEGQQEGGEKRKNNELRVKEIRGG
jgi:predicted transposase YdaD